MYGKNSKYYACLSTQVERQQLPHRSKQIGVALGFRHLAITSEGETFDAPKYLLPEIDAWSLTDVMSEAKKREPIPELMIWNKLLRDESSVLVSIERISHYLNMGIWTTFTRMVVSEFVQ